MSIVFRYLYSTGQIRRGLICYHSSSSYYHRFSYNRKFSQSKLSYFSSTPQTPNEENNNKKNENKNKKLYSLLPGIALSATTAGAGFQIASLISSVTSLPISGIPLSILLGMVVKNTIGYNQEKFSPGLTFSTKQILQGGIVAVAAKLSFYELITTGSSCIPVVVSSMGAGLLFIPLAGKAAGLSDKTSLLLTAGTSICGVTAITALAPAINASNRDTAIAVANTVAFGTIGMLMYPYLFHTLCSSSEQIGLCLGVAIHDTSQVLGSAMSYRQTYGDDVVMTVATITKLTRNLGLAFMIPSLTLLDKSKIWNTNQSGDIATYSESKMAKNGGTISGLATFQKYVPNFLMAFIAVSMLRSGGDFYFQNDYSGDLSVEQYAYLMDFIGNDVSKYALGTAMAGVGLCTNAASLKGVGWRPFAVGGLGALLVGGTGFSVAHYLF